MSLIQGPVSLRGAQFQADFDRWVTSLVPPLPADQACFDI